MSPQSFRLFNENLPELCLSLQNTAVKHLRLLLLSLLAWQRCYTAPSQTWQTGLEWVQKKAVQSPVRQGGFITQHLISTALYISSVVNIFVSGK